MYLSYFVIWIMPWGRPGSLTLWFLGWFIIFLLSLPLPIFVIFFHHCALYLHFFYPFYYFSLLFSGFLIHLPKKSILFLLLSFISYFLTEFLVLFKTIPLDNNRDTDRFKRVWLIGQDHKISQLEKTGNHMDRASWTERRGQRCRQNVMDRASWTESRGQSVTYHQSFSVTLSVSMQLGITIIGCSNMSLESVRFRMELVFVIIWR